MKKSKNRQKLWRKKTIKERKARKSCHYHVQVVSGQHKDRLLDCPYKETT